MVDRVSFTQGINYDNGVQPVLKGYFDDIMALYDLIGDRKDIHISTESSESSVRFNINLQSDDIAKELKDAIDNKLIRKYNHTFTVQSTIHDNRLNVVLKE
jgi:hypothetical protein